MVPLFGAGHPDLQAQFETAFDALWIAYQPIFDRDLNVIGYEALVRFDAGDFRSPIELLAAADALSAAERLGGRIRALVPRPFKTRPRDLLFMNVDPEHVHLPYMRFRDDSLAQMADRVVLELTERTSPEHMTNLEVAVLKLKSIGFGLAVDDLGAGYSGVASFVQMSPDFVKLDERLVSQVGGCEDKQRVIAGITKCCHELGIKVIAEGVENAADGHALHALGCDLFQGYLFGRPEPLE